MKSPPGPGGERPAGFARAGSSAVKDSETPGIPDGKLVEDEGRFPLTGEFSEQIIRGKIAKVSHLPSNPSGESGSQCMDHLCPDRI